MQQGGALRRLKCRHYSEQRLDTKRVVAVAATAILAATLATAALATTLATSTLAATPFATVAFAITATAAASTGTQRREGRGECAPSPALAQPLQLGRRANRTLKRAQRHPQLPFPRRLQLQAAHLRTAHAPPTTEQRGLLFTREHAHPRAADRHGDEFECLARRRACLARHGHGPCTRRVRRRDRPEDPFLYLVERWRPRAPDPATRW